MKLFQFFLLAKLTHSHTAGKYPVTFEKVMERLQDYDLSNEDLLDQIFENYVG